jgi:hypothetical protein
VIVYATVFGDTDVPYVVDGRRKNAGIQYTYSVLPDYFAEPPYDVYSNLKNTLQPAAVLTTSIPIGSDVTNPAYTSFDPMLIHNNPSEGADIDAVRARVLGYPLPAPEDFPSWGDPATLGVKPGALVGIRIQRAGYTGPSTDEYAGSIGFINLRWSLVTV